MRNYTRHTVESLTAELTKAEKAGSLSEVRDLELLIRHLREPGTILPGAVQAARNRQGGRRVARASRDPAYRARLTPRVGDTVRDPGGGEWRLERVDRKRSGAVGWGRFQDKPIFCPIGLLAIVGASESPPQDRFREPAERLYAALWDVLDRPDDAGWRERVESALRAYEAALEGVS